eukprot:CAMPEP_0206604842 /NCGR_PEP_ID=MMETSP0325_2-20121206/49833_1 /ASSEMBLY_ACC=CAM_ASM_000347 /TAXON_ID=2866 /ORGANISM="Crypthecodinium cohnii, Strain Seligo" /LENGTH=39 /DNA_ID= /DNA_START= /DNA_END= /DNA_ORIENTATION=
METEFDVVELDNCREDAGEENRGPAAVGRLLEIRSSGPT